VGAAPGRLRIGFCRHPGAGRESAPDCVVAVEAAARLLESLGHRVEESAPEALGGSGTGIGFARVMAVAVAREIERWSERLGRRIALEELEPFSAWMAGFGRGVSGPQYAEAIEALQAWSRRALAWWARGFDVLLTPTAPAPPPKLGFLDPRQPVSDLGARMAEFTLFTAPFNVTGQPAISLPLHTSDAGLPIGVQLVAATAREDVLIRLAAQVEQAATWSARRPPLHA
jgi:amidase